MTTYSDHEQRRLDQQSGAAMDRRTPYLAAEIRRLAANPDTADLLTVAAQVERMERFVDTLVGDAAADAQTLAGLIRRLPR